MTVIIGIDPHKRSHTAVAIGPDEQVLDQLRLDATAGQAERLLAWADRFEQRRWAIEAAAGLGHLLAQQLVAAGEDVVDVPPVLACRVRLLGNAKASKTDPNDALSVAVSALRAHRLRAVTLDDHAQVLRLLADRHRDLTALRTQAACRLHALVAALVPGGLGRRTSAAVAAQTLAKITIAGPVEAERHRQALELLGDIERLDGQLKTTRQRIEAEVDASGTTVVEVHGVGPIGAALIVGHVRDVSRFPTAGHFASYNGTAPVEASSGPVKRHRLNLRGNRQINHALHIAAVTQLRNDTAGRAYYLRKIEEGKRPKEALRALKRRISDAVYRQLVLDARARTDTPAARPLELAS